MSRASALLRLQTIDLELDTLQARLQQIEAALSDSPAVRAAQKELIEAQTQRDVARIGMQELESEEQSLQARQAEVSDRLYGGRVTNPKELQDLQRDLEMVKRQGASAEEKQLQALIDAENAEARWMAAQTSLQNSEREAAQQNNTLLDELTRLRERATQLAKDREGVAVAIRADDRGIYEQLRQSKRGRAVAQLVEGVCAACGVAPSAARVQEARNGIDLIRCGNCGRILCAE